MEDLLRAGMIGEVLHVTVRVNKTVEPDIVGAARNPDNWRLTPEQAGGGYFYDLASHQLDVLDYLLGSIAGANGMAANRPGACRRAVEDTTMGRFGSKNGVLGQGVWCSSASVTTHETCITLVGTAGRIRFSCFSGQGVTW